MNTEIKLECFLDDVKRKLERELKDQEISLLCWIHSQQFLENQWKRMGV